MHMIWLQFVTLASALLTRNGIALSADALKSALDAYEYIGDVSFEQADLHDLMVLKAEVVPRLNQRQCREIAALSALAQLPELQHAISSRLYNSRHLRVNFNQLLHTTLAHVPRDMVCNFISLNGKAVVAAIPSDISDIGLSIGLKPLFQPAETVHCVPVHVPQGEKIVLRGDLRQELNPMSLLAYSFEKHYPVLQVGMTIYVFGHGLEVVKVYPSGGAIQTKNVNDVIII